MKKNQLVAYLNVIFVVLFATSVSHAQLQEADVEALNTILGQNKTLSEWENLTRLHLKSLPEEQFPDAFDRLNKLEIIDLLPESSFVNCREQNLGGARDKTNRFLEQSFKDREICLSGRNFILIDKQGGGKMAGVYIIEDPITKMRFAFTRYDSESEKHSLGAKLILSKARKSKNLVNMPVLVNTKENYIISPLMLGRHVVSETAAFNRFWTGGGCELLMREDGIWSGHDVHDKNYMYKNPESRLPKAIDFRTFTKLVGIPDTPKYGPMISLQDKDPNYCKKIYDEEAAKEKSFVEKVEPAKEELQPNEQPSIKPIKELTITNRESCAKACHDKLVMCIENPILQIDRFFVCGKQYSLCFATCE